MGGCAGRSNVKPNDGSVNANKYIWSYKPVNVKLVGDEAIEWMEDNGYTIDSHGKSYVIIRGDSHKVISAGAFYSGKLYDKNNQVVGSLIISDGEISININREGKPELVPILIDD